jgi:hypothetical protein
MASRVPSGRPQYWFAFQDFQPNSRISRPSSVASAGREPDFPTIQNYICTFSNATAWEISAAGALFGGIPINGSSAPLRILIRADSLWPFVQRWVSELFSLLALIQWQAAGQLSEGEIRRLASVEAVDGSLLTKAAKDDSMRFTQTASSLSGRMIGYSISSTGIGGADSSISSAWTRESGLRGTHEKTRKAQAERF